STFNGAGDTWTPTWINLVGFWFFQTTSTGAVGSFRVIDSRSLRAKPYPLKRNYTTIFMNACMICPSSLTSLMSVM
ncbi:MAG: hypothetical protein EOO39_11565, partial [Cytophagaceae bacterium]